MRDPWGLNERLFAWYYPKLVALSENAGQREVRRELVSHASGRTLEVGAGSGLNVPHYPAAVTELVLSEPSSHMRKRLRAALADDPPPVTDWRVEPAGAEQLPFADQSFDTAVLTFVLCSVSDPARSIAELCRVLRPGGRLLFCEHVHAGEGTLLGRVQDLVELPHRYLAAGCHPNRRTERLLDASGLEVTELEHGRMPRSIPTVRPTIAGLARRAQEQAA
ncbi:MAG: methyltransferase domain-containing protein [Solirubrobacterales bacterium]|nr:methyltransferase domain-containing protein [Solirubrobacterales bacterium]